MSAEHPIPDEAVGCENCGGTGIYEEGEEWAPCDECMVGQSFARYLRIAADEARQQERERLRGLIEAAADRYEAASRDEHPAPWKLELAKAEGLMQFLDILDQDGESNG